MRQRAISGAPMNAGSISYPSRPTIDKSPCGQSRPANFGTRAALVGAEIARLENREIDAQRLYEEAVRLAKEHGFIQNEAMANELAGRFYGSRDLETSADAYLRNARCCYLRWGAHSKVRQLDQLYPKVKERSTARLKADDGLSLEELDLAAIMKMSQALSGEIILSEGLIERLMVTVVEHAGAVRGLLLLRKEGEMGIAAEAVTTRQGVTVDVRQQQLSGELPESLLNTSSGPRRPLSSTTRSRRKATVRILTSSVGDRVPSFVFPWVGNRT